MRLFLSGMFTALAFVVSLFFLRFYTRTHDRLFICFAFAFLLLGVERVMISILEISNENVGLVILMRLVSLTLILGAIVDKNRRGAS
ncbi:MAG TPA: DUF5985 family protein [Oligoflexus sp.]|uniref:DUF5985 family protein n=1 Tax=Oligoflexus sp. TaxID=1971216 RepID=UPI002D3E6492|nr:DUF5985 family protein [Oligoflexus sp.]HYX33083.1 DUF5985 family protein [Oligoflexus sp.]